MCTTAKVRTDLQHGRWYGDEMYIYPMHAWLGKDVTLTGRYPTANGAFYTIKEDNGQWRWSEEMFEEVLK